MNALEETVAQFIGRHGLFAGAGRILLAVSGGADSTALLHVLLALKSRGRIEADLVCAHINHQLRSAASDADEQFVMEQASRLGLPVVTRAVEVREHARRQRLSLETAARQLRLASLAEIAHSRQCTWIGTGHQKDDNAETILQRLLRGTGFRGLAGIRPRRPFNDLRLASPLLCVTRAEIGEYLTRHNLPWREDATNVDLAYTRNYLRHRLLPFLRQEARGDLMEELSELAASGTRLADRVERETREAWRRLIQSTADEIVIQASSLAALPELVAVELIRQAAAGLTAGAGELTEAHYRAILALARRSPGGKRLSLPRGLIVRCEQGHLVLGRGREVGCVSRTAPAIDGTVRGTHPTAPVVLPVPGRTQFAGWEIDASILQHDEVGAAKLGADKGPFIEYFDLDRVKLPVMVRTRRPGDRFQPLGMAGEKKIGKFLTTAKAPRDLRERILILADREMVIWVCPVRISEQAKITDTTHRVLQLTIRDL